MQTADHSLFFVDSEYLQAESEVHTFMSWEGHSIGLFRVGLIQMTRP